MKTYLKYIDSVAMWLCIVLGILGRSYLPIFREILLDLPVSSVKFPGLLKLIAAASVGGMLTFVVDQGDLIGKMKNYRRRIYTHILYGVAYIEMLEKFLGG